MNEKISKTPAKTGAILCDFGKSKTVSLRYFPRRSRLNQTNQLFLEDILLESKEASCSFEGDVTTDH